MRVRARELTQVRSIEVVDGRGSVLVSSFVEPFLDVGLLYVDVLNPSLYFADLAHLCPKQRGRVGEEGNGRGYMIGVGRYGQLLAS